jgi:hypothetical protein
MQNRYTNFAIRPNVGVEYGGHEAHDGRIIWIRMRKLEGSLKYAPLIQRAFRAHYANRPVEKIISVQTSGKTIVSVPTAKSLQLLHQEFLGALLRSSH